VPSFGTGQEVHGVNPECGWCVAASGNAERAWHLMRVIQVMHLEASIGLAALCLGGLITPCRITQGLGSGGVGIAIAVRHPLL
jgi:hypothetical protein